MADETFEQRAARSRRTWSGRVSSDHRAMQASETTIQERIGHMAALAESAWAMTGQALPTYTRADMPGRVIRQGIDIDAA